ncbi:hypothetical protein [Flavobacterium sp. 9AF]|uniref:hypothetical protein n=1 Tax=Flavobacterium sp. 9AF TaxID=2653142 RepID=UPI0013584295|nr:hypothetical protein [Flavobacterium sp. 9AF]
MNKTTFFLAFIFTFYSFTSYSQEEAEIRSMSQEQLDFFEGKLTFLTKYELFDIEKEPELFKDFLTSEKELLIYLESLIRIKNPSFEDFNNLIYYIGEDKLKKMWFVNFKLNRSFIGNGVKLIIVKNNCKIVFMEKTK